ncbi:hypothetical protein J5N97_005570 [Dioscorea zingiberensis]|uniref:Protein TIFY n=1 Tax=Dioscorea zingiberensis TaxID=325984 RepID=A0A9D5HSF2_9LILI|nr:hypothetical protein J5N97_005570 [Dioscorea zingiberensis]
MERDFLGLSGKEVKGEAGGGRQGSVSTLQWPFATQHFISHKAGQQKRPKNRDFDQYSGARYRPVLTMDSCEPKINTGESPQIQKTFISGKQGSRQFALQPHHSPNSDSFGALKHKVNEIRAYQTHHHSIPVLEGSPFFPVHGARNGPDLTVRGIAALNSPAAGCTGGALAPRIMSKPSAMSAQLTMFYAGAVNVYNDIPPDKAQAIMSLASKVASDVVNSRFEKTPLLAPIEVMMVDGMSTDETQTQILNHKMPNCPMLPILKSVTSQTGPHSCSGSGIANDFPCSKATEIVVPSRQNDIPKIITNSSVPNVTRPIVQRAVPQARNASLARFLEKRKERVSNASPYTCPSKASEGIPGLEENNSSSKISLLDIASSRNLAHSSRLGSPNTKLEI